MEQKKVFAISLSGAEILRITNALIRDADDSLSRGYSAIHKHDLDLASRLINLYSCLSHE